MTDTTNVNKNTLYNTLKSVFSIIYPLITFPYISRVLQTDNIGKLNFSNSIVSYFSLIASLGVSMYAIRECAKYRDDAKGLGNVASEILSINIFSTIFAFIGLAITLIVARSLDSYRTLIIIQSTTILFTTFGADWINTAMEDFQFITLRTIAMQLVSLLLMFMFIHRQEDYIKYAVISVVASSGANIVNTFYRRKYCTTRFVLQNQWRKHLPPIMRLFAMLCAQSILTSCDTTIIGLTLGDHFNGVYGTALRVYNIAVQLTASITWVVVPQLSHAFANKDTDKIKKLFEYCLNYSFVLGVPLAVGMVSLSKEIILCVGGLNYIEASTVLVFLSITYFLTLFSNFFLNVYMLASGQDRISMISCIIAAVFNLIGNILLIPIFGINAAAWTTAFSQLIIIQICYRFRDKTIKMLPLMKTIVQPLIAVVGMLGVIVGVKMLTENIFIRLIISIVIGGTVYFICLYYMKNQFVIEMKNKTFNKHKP